jgi:hypothetical protein
VRGGSISKFQTPPDREDEPGRRRIVVTDARQRQEPCRIDREFTRCS